MASSASSSSSHKMSSLLDLPISPSAPIYHLRPDPLFPTPSSLLRLGSYEAPDDLGEKGPVAIREGDPVPPSMLRRSRQIREGGAFTFTSPLPLEFPYDIREPGDEERTNAARASTIETQLATFEVSPAHPVYPPSSPAPSSGTAPSDDAAAPSSAARPTAFTSPRRLSPSFPRAQLLSVSRALAAAWLPQLDLDSSPAVRDQFLDVVAGKTVLAREADPDADDEADGVRRMGFAPWSLCYAGHQFGSFAGQLGDGRAISILSTPTTEEVAARTGFRAIELQLKGAGRTPYSRFADGLAVLRSSIREYLGAEAVAALGVPTSRALALVHLPEVHVRREQLESAAIVTRVSGSWIRIGNFEQQAYRGEYDSLRLLSRYVAREVFALSDDAAHSAGGFNARSQALAVVKEVARRNAVTVAGWQAYGFMHGVMNTDNIAVNGATIDYGPYAFMDVFDPAHICNHSDDSGRYRFELQPSMMVFAINKLGEALAELIGCELELAERDGGADKGLVEAPEGWAGEGEGSAEMKRWKEEGMEAVGEVKKDFVETFKREYERLMRLRFGFATAEEGDFQLFSQFLDLMAEHELDFTNTHRLLSQFTSTSAPTFAAFLDALLSRASSSSFLTARADWTSFLASYEARLSREGAPAASDRRARMDRVNPRFTLRQWVLEETIAAVTRAPEPGGEGVRQLERVLELATRPFEAYGEVEIGRGEREGRECPTKEEMERQRLCGVGESSMLGFQCSCSS
ncbi:Fmp40p [Rhodotorula paludigena]|uniref:Fmp40p n=1 Tax=Rhodotorula paludigena TaxID=86838 RepID=UPI00317D7D28